MAEITKAVKDMSDRLRKDKKALLTVIVGFSGMLLIMLSELPFFTSSAEADDCNIELLYNENLEQEVERLISEVDGAGKVSVMLTYESDEEKIYAKDTEREIQGDNETQSSDRHIIVDSSEGETGLIVKRIYPEIRGVAVVCTGADNPVVRSEISALVSALFDIGSNRISIARRAEEE